MSIFALKLIAILTMLIDHIGAIFLLNNPTYYWPARIIGRIAFPIFVFMLIEGFQHTSNIRKYLTRLGIFALISEIPFDLAFYKGFYGSDVLVDIKASFTDAATMDLLIRRLLSHQNVFFTLFLGLLAVYYLNKIENKFKKNILLSNVFNALITIGFCAAALILRTDYNMKGILLIVAFYLFRGSKILLAICMLIVTGYLFQDANGQITIEIFATLAMVPIFFYNGKKGKNIKYLFYIFYPAHLLILWLFSFVI